MLIRACLVGSEHVYVRFLVYVEEAFEMNIALEVAHI
jgi:hypothetical protein